MYSYDEMTLLRLQLGRWAPTDKAQGQHAPRPHKTVKIQQSPRGQNRFFGVFSRKKKVRPAGL